MTNVEDVCPYCYPKQSGAFKDVKHIYPAALGGKILLSKDSYCDSCNKKLSQEFEHAILNFLAPYKIPEKNIDNQFQKIVKIKNHDVPSFLRNDKNLERSRLEQLIKGISGRDLVCVDLKQDKIEHFQETGKFSFSIRRKQPSLTQFSRFFYKIAFELFWLETSKEFILQDNFSEIREYIRYSKLNKFFPFFISTKPVLSQFLEKYDFLIYGIERSCFVIFRLLHIYISVLLDPSILLNASAYLNAVNKILLDEQFNGKGSIFLENMAFVDCPDKKFSC